MSDTLNKSAEGTPPKKRAQKLKEETPTKKEFAGAKSDEVIAEFFLLDSLFIEAVTLISQLSRSERSTISNNVLYNF